MDMVHGQSESDRPQKGTALCLSGGGYRAMIFHLGALWRLNEIGYLGRLKRVSSVSGGSITAGMLGLRWSKLGFRKGIARNFVSEVVEPLRRLAGVTIDVRSILAGLFLPGGAGGRIASAYDRYLFHGATLADLPRDPPRFVINATNVQTGDLWRFSRPYMRDYKVGEVKNPRLRLSAAVAASSAFPPVLSPMRLKLKAGDYTESAAGREPLHHKPFTTRVVLTDGGVYDNLGLETAWKRCATILASDAGGELSPEERPSGGWLRHGIRALFIIDNQVRSLRKRQLIDSFRAKTRDGAYWGIRADISHYGLPDALHCPSQRTLELARLATRLKRLDPETQERLINWGYAVCDAAIRRHLEPALPPPAGFPYPRSAV